MNQERVRKAVWDWRAVAEAAAPATVSPADAAGGRRAALPSRSLVVRRSLWALGAAAVLVILGQRTLGAIAAGAGAGSLILGIVRPRAWARLSRLADRFGGAVGRLLGVVLLAPVFLAVIVPGGLWLRLRGRDPLHRRLRAPGLSYWIRRRAQPAPPQYARQFLIEDKAARAERRPLPVPEQGGGA